MRRRIVVRREGSGWLMTLIKFWFISTVLLPLIAFVLLAILFRWHFR